jgi:hypothetical protein
MEQLEDANGSLIVVTSFFPPVAKATYISLTQDFEGSIEDSFYP